MADFTTTQGQLQAALDALDQAQVAATQAAARARQTQAALVAATRSGDRQVIAQQSAAATRAGNAQSAAAASVKTARSQVSEATLQFAQFSDPRRGVGGLLASSPFLLFPVRIETRFRTVGAEAVPGAVAALRHQLWVRIYPDDCSIDTFEPVLSTAELVDVKTYWMNLWAAGGMENAERGAWSGLAGTRGPGRAGWLVDHYQPTNLSDQPKKTDASDEILVIPATMPLTAADASALNVYWAAVWMADGDKAKMQAAQNALETAVGAAHAAELVAGYVPFNLADKPAAPLSKSAVKLSTAFVLFPPDPETTQLAWSQAPQVRQFPDRFVVMGFSGTAQTLEALGNPITLPLYTGPDPSADQNDTIRPDPAPDGPDLFIPDELQWMVDFDRAVAAGMALAIDITQEQARAGFTRLIVLGLKLSTTAEHGSAALQELLQHHHDGSSGFAFVPQGTPAHNSTGAGSGFPQEDADSSFDDRKNAPLFHVTSDPLQKADGQWFAEWLGLDPAFVANVHASGGLDQQQARAMQTALWPATLGYWMDTLWTPATGKASIFSDETIASARAFFTQFVSGRGPLPAIRIGGQPYGILPVTAFSRMQWFQQQQFRETVVPASFFGHLYSVLKAIDTEWGTLAQTVATVGDTGDPHQTLLNVLAQHPSSVEYYSRNAESLEQLYNMMSVFALALRWIPALQIQNQAEAVALLQQLGYGSAALPDLLNHFFLTDNPQVGAVIDDRPLSETNAIRAYTPAGKNYIEWMIDAAGSLDTLRTESGFTDGNAPQALLYLYLRHALMLGYYASSYNYHRSLGILASDALMAMRLEPTFVHVDPAAKASESRFAALYKTESRITGSPTLLVSDFIGKQISTGTATETAFLAAQVAALKLLADASTAQLERLFAEHIDTCSYRYDAWLLGLVNQRIATQRGSAGADGNGKTTGGLYLGAYAWVENLLPSQTALTAAQIPQNLLAQFAGSEPLMSDPAGGGYVHAPSIPHASAAAVLRSGYLANASSGNPDTLAVNLSSDRVRLAMGLIEGIRNGQSLGALLGYRFERGLHDAYTFVEADKFIYPLRKVFPLVADALADTKTGPTIPIEAIEASNVLDGKKLLDRVQSSGIKTYPYGLTGLLAVTDPAQQTALDDQTLALLDAYDAVADLALAEGVYQAVQGNYDRVASTIDAYTTGNFPPEPQVIQTPPAGVTLTHRFALQLKPGLTAAAGATPRVQAEPAINEWLGRMLPSLSQIGCMVTWSDSVSGSAQQQQVMLDDLDLAPLDLLSLLKPDSQQAMAELDDRILRRVRGLRAPRPDTVMRIQYMQPGTAKFSMFEVGPLLRELRTMATQSRPLRASDVQRANDATAGANAAVFADATRISAPAATLKALGVDISALLSTLQPLLTDTVLNRTQIITNVDTNIDKTGALLERASRFAIPGSGWGFLYEWKRGSFSGLLTQVSLLVTRWNQKLADFDAALTAYDSLPAATSDADRFAALQAAELMISSALDPLPASPATLRAALNGKRAPFQGRRDQFAALLSTTTPSFATLFNSASALSTQEFDSQPFDISSFGNGTITITEDLARVLISQLALVQQRVADVQTKLDTAAAASSAADQVAAIQAAAKILLGDDFQILPEFTVTAAQGAEWANALVASNGGSLFTYVKATLKIDFPVYEWIAGVARVRPPLHSWEAATALATAFGIAETEPAPVQLPFEANAPWLALEFPDDYKLDSDRLLYTCIYSETFDPTKRQCGLLLDEWSEALPATTRDTAVTFNYNRPDNEPPQSMLLVTPATNSETWQWVDLVDAVMETIDLVKKRAVEPTMLDTTAYSRFLPATVTASTTYGITISTALTTANGAFQLLREKHV